MKWGYNATKAWTGQCYTVSSQYCCVTLSSFEDELKAHQLQQEITHEEAVSRLAHDDLLTENEGGESQQLEMKLKEEVCEHKINIFSCIVFMIIQ